MNKKKRTLLTTIVFLSVFWLSEIMNIPPFWFSMEPQEPKKKEAAPTLVDAPAPTDIDDINIFSFSTTVSTEDMQEEAKKAPSPTEVPKAIVGPEEAAAASSKEHPKVDMTKLKESSLYADIGISVASDFVNIREAASTESEILGKLYKDSAAKILKTQDEWYYVESGSVRGYVSSEFIKTHISDAELIEHYGEQSIQVDTDGLNVRKDRDKTSDRLDVVYRGEVYPVLETDEEWVKINIPDNKITGYVLREYVEMTVKFKKAISKEEEAELLQLQAEERAKEETTIKQQEGVDYTNSELKLLTCLVHAEAGTQSYEGKLAVANIVLNRMKSSKYPDSMKSVIYQPGQFSVARSGSLEKQLNNYDNYCSWSQKLSIKAAKAALTGSNNIGSRLYFHSYHSAVRKGYNKKKSAVKIDDQLFW